MARINEIKEEKIVVQSVGGFAQSLQQIAAGRMVKLRKLVMSSKRFADEATVILRELELERTKKLARELGVEKSSLKSTKKTSKNPLSRKKKPEPPKDPEDLNTAIIVVSSSQGLCGSYNTDIFKKVESIVDDHLKADYFVIGTKGQEYFIRFSKKHNIRFFPYNIPEEVKIEDLRPLIGMFYHYDQIYIIYSKYVNTTTREPTFLELAVPNIEAEEIKKEAAEGRYIFEPDIDQLISAVSAKLRYALFRQQILDSKLSLYTAQMIAMQTAADNAIDLLKDLQLQYNKARRKLIDKKIQEVQAGRALWGEEA